MANNIEFKIILDGLDDFQNNLTKGSAALNQLGQSTVLVGRELSKIGSISLLAGAALSGPLVLAFKDSAKYSAAVSQEINALSQVTEDFQKQIANAMVPTVSKFIGIVDGLYNAFNTLTPAVKTQLIETVLLTGVFLTVSGLVELVSGRVLTLVGDLEKLTAKFLGFAAVNPVMVALIVAFAFLAVLMVKFKDVATDTLNVFQFLFEALKNGFLVVETNITYLLSKIYEGLAQVYGFLAKLPGPAKQFFESSANGAANLAKSLNDISISAGNSIKTIGQMTTQITDSSTSWATAFQNAKQKVIDFLDALKGGAGATGPGAGESFFNGIEDGLQQIGVKLSNLKQQGIDFTNTLQTGFSTAMSNIILGTESAKQAFEEFGASILKAIVDFMTQWIAFQILSKALGAAATAFGITQATTLAIAYAPAAAMASLASFGANAAPAEAGIGSTVALANVLAIPKLEFGTSGFPDDTLSMINKNEIVIPATFSQSIQKGDLSLSGGQNDNSNGGNTIFDFRGALINGVSLDLVKQIFKQASEGIRGKIITPLPV